MPQCISHKVIDIGYMFYDIYGNYNIKLPIWIDLCTCFSENIYTIRLSYQ